MAIRRIETYVDEPQVSGGLLAVLPLLRAIRDAISGKNLKCWKVA